MHAAVQDRMPNFRNWLRPMILVRPCALLLHVGRELGTWLAVGEQQNTVPPEIGRQSILSALIIAVEIMPLPRLVACGVPIRSICCMMGVCCHTVACVHAEQDFRD